MSPPVSTKSTKKGIEKAFFKVKSAGRQALAKVQKNRGKHGKKIRGYVADSNEDVVVLLGAPADNIRDLDNKWRIIADFKKSFKGGGNYGLHLVENRKDGRWAIRKHIIPNEFDPTRTPGSMARFRTLHHRNICKFIDGYFSGKYYRMYLELCDLGDLDYWLERNNGADWRKFPGPFWWHVVESILRATCYLTYGWNTLEETIREGKEKDGWDPVFHGDWNKTNIFLKSAGPGRYPVLKVADFDNCYGRKDYRDRNPDSDQDPVGSFDAFLRRDLYTIWSMMTHDIVPRNNHLPETDALHKEFLNLCNGKDKMVLDAREMAKLFLEVKAKNNIVYGSFPNEFLAPHELFKPHLERKRKGENKNKGSKSKRKRDPEGETEYNKEKSPFDDEEYNPLSNIEEEDSDEQDLKRRKSPRNISKSMDFEPSPKKRKSA